MQKLEFTDEEYILFNAKL